MADTVSDIPGVGPVDMTGKCVGPGTTSAVIHRDAALPLPNVGDSGTVPIKMLDLSLKSTHPISLGTSFFDVSMELDPAALGLDVGTMTITRTSTDGGTFDASVDVHGKVTATEVGNPSNMLSFVLTPNVATSYRSLVLTWFGGYLVAVGGAYVPLSNQAAKVAPQGIPQTDIFSGCPQRLRRAGYIVIVAAFTAFFVAIARVETAVVNRSVGEAAILGAFSAGAFAAMFGGLWSALSRAHQNAA